MAEIETQFSIKRTTESPSELNEGEG